MEDIVKHLVSTFYQRAEHELPPDIIKQLNELDRAERGALKSRIFNEAKRLAQGADALTVLRWVESSFDLIEKYSFRLHEVLFSPGQDIPENIAFYLSQAKKSIDICIYTISDETLSQCLKKMHEKGIEVRIITDNHKMQDAGSQIKYLARCGLKVKIDNSKYHMHNKFGIIDGRICFTGSYNWTYTARQYNQENIIITTNYRIVKLFSEEFNRLWEVMFWLRLKPFKRGEEEKYRAQINLNTNKEMLNTIDNITDSITEESDTSNNDGSNGYDSLNVNPFDDDDFFDIEEAEKAKTISTQKPIYDSETKEKNDKAEDYKVTPRNHNRDQQSDSKKHPQKRFRQYKNGEEAEEFNNFKHKDKKERRDNNHRRHRK